MSLQLITVGNGTCSLLCIIRSVTGIDIIPRSYQISWYRNYYLFLLFLCALCGLIILKH